MNWLSKRRSVKFPMYLFISIINILVTAILAAFWNTWFFLAVFEWAAPAAASTILSTIFRYFGPGWLAESGRPIWNPTLPIFYDFFPRNAQRYRFLDSLGTVVYSSTTRAAVAASKRRRRRGGGGHYQKVWSSIRKLDEVWYFFFLLEHNSETQAASAGPAVGCRVFFTLLLWANKLEQKYSSRMDRTRISLVGSNFISFWTGWLLFSLFPK